MCPFQAWWRLLQGSVISNNLIQCIGSSNSELRREIKVVLSNSSLLLPRLPELDDRYRGPKGLVVDSWRSAATPVRFAGAAPQVHETTSVMDAGGSAIDGLRALRTVIGCISIAVRIRSGYATVIVYSVREVGENKAWKAG